MRAGLLIVDSEKLCHPGSPLMFFIAPAFQVSEQLGLYGDSGFDSLECNFPDTNRWICCMKPKSEQALARMQKERSRPVSAFGLWRPFFFCLMCRERFPDRSAAFSANHKRLVGLIPL